MSCSDYGRSVARASALSRPHLFELFRSNIGTSPLRYASAQRMEAAFAALPTNTTQTLADSLGFSEPQHFTRFFRHNLGFAPSVCRARVEMRL